MIITTQKPFEEIKKAAEGCGSLFLLGCGDCATLCHTGGEAELQDMAEKLKADGIAVAGHAIVAAACHELDTRRILRAHKDELADADGILVLTCGAGVQAVGDGQEKPAISGCDSLFIGNSKRQMHFYEKCSACGACVLNLTAGLCPETRCPKSLVNGPCGGAVHGKCEVHPDNDCVWVLIFERLKERGQLDRLLEIQPAKDNRALAKPLKLEKPLRPAAPKKD